MTPDTLTATLADRGKTHGNFMDNSTIGMLLRCTWRAAPNWNRLSPVQQLALDEIALKIARILSAGSDPNNPEHWHDLAGYAILGEPKP